MWVGWLRLKEGRVKSASLSRYKERKGRIFEKGTEQHNRNKKSYSITKSGDCHYRIASVPQDVIGEAVLGKGSGTTQIEDIMIPGAQAIHCYFHPFLHLPRFPFA